MMVDIKNLIPYHLSLIFLTAKEQTNKHTHHHLNSTNPIKRLYHGTLRQQIHQKLGLHFHGLG